MAQKERRSQNRTSLIGEKVIRTTNVFDPSTMEESIEAEILNISNGGLCLSVARPLKESDVIKVVIPLSKDLLAVPTLGEVRWLKPDEGDRDKRYTVGLRFII